MKINDVEKLLGITKANIRFYEKEGLITPERSKNGYREYSASDIRLLKEIIILRKLGISVQQIADILDGALSLQDALDCNISALQQEIKTLNGSLALCKQLKQEEARMLDTERYWKLIQEQEFQGLQFQSLLEDYLKFSEINYAWLFWPLPIDDLRSPWKVGTFIAGLSVLNALSRTMINGSNFFLTFLQQVLSFLSSLAVWTAIFVPLYILSKKKAKLANGIMTALLIAMPVAMIALVCLVFLIPYL